MLTYVVHKTIINNDIVEFQQKSANFSSNIDEIYKNSEDRQDKLVGIFFDLCLEISFLEFIKNERDFTTLKKNGILNKDFPEEIHNKFDDYELYEFLLANNYIIKSSSFKNRKHVIDFMKTNNDFFVFSIVDGNVKSKYRAMEKSCTLYNCNIGMINDINRITIIGTKLELFDVLFDRIKIRFNQRNILLRKHWEVKSLGNLTRSSYILIDNFISEIHFAEKNQFFKASVYPHKIYELYRYKIDNKEEFDKFIKKSIDFFRNYDSTLVVFFEKAMYSDLEKLKSFLLKLHKFEYLKSFEDFERDWLELYLECLKKMEIKEFKKSYGK